MVKKIIIRIIIIFLDRYLQKFWPVTITDPSVLEIIIQIPPPKKKQLRKRPFITKLSPPNILKIPQTQNK